MPAERDPLAAARLHVLLLMFVVGAGAGYLLVHLFSLQVTQQGTQTEIGDRQRTRRVTLAPARGLVADRWGSPLAELRPTVDIDLYLLELKSYYHQTKRSLPMVSNQVRIKGVWKEQKEVDIVTIVDECIAPFKRILGEKLQYDPEKLKRHQREEEGVPFKVSSDLTFAELSQISEQNPNLPGVVLTPRPKRRYSYGATASHIIGYVSEPEKAKLIERDGIRFHPDLVGREGIEESLDQDLQGNPGERVLEVNRRGTVQKVLEQRNPTLGNTVELTIDLRVQQIVEKVMASVGRGAAVVMDCNTGEILALASVPNYDPNTVIAKPEVWRDIGRNDAKPLLNRCLSAYAPGSIFKPIVALAALKHTNVSPDFATSCSGGLTVSDRYKKCWSYTSGGCGRQSMVGALKRSCNVYFYTVGMRTGADRVGAVARDLLLGQRTGVPLGGEVAGIIPGPDWMRQYFPRDRWSAGHMANMAIGQGFVEVSPLQMTVAAATIANGGTVYRPRLVSRVVTADGRVARDESKPEVVHRLGMNPSDVEVVRRGMRAVVNEPDGTGKAAALEDHIVAGKTGTAQFTTRYNGQTVKDQRTWFMSFAPYDKPRYAVVVMVEGGDSGGKTCAPLVRSIYREIFDLEKFNRPYELTYLQPVRGHFGGVKALDAGAPAPAPARDTDDPGQENE